ncbi:S8/S53 family peptidase [bacterium]|nr:S8/S53 family peptidase [bacterium]
MLKSHNLPGRLLLALVLLGLLLPAACTRRSALDTQLDSSQDAEPRVVAYDPQRYPGIQCLEDRVIVETSPRLSAAQREQLWREYGLELSFEWLAPKEGFTYHELRLRPWTALQRGRNLLARALQPGTPALASRHLPELVSALNDDPRINWACPDALLLEWADSAAIESSGSAGSAAPATAAQPPQTAEAERSASLAAGLRDGEGVCFVDQRYRPLDGGLKTWAEQSSIAGGAQWQPPFPDFEYYRRCRPEGSLVDWADVLASDATFMSFCRRIHGTGQQQALEAYRAAGAPELSPVTVCVADTGVLFEHPDYSARLHPNSIDANYSNYRIAAGQDRPSPSLKIEDRSARVGIGLPRDAIKQQPASHGTAVAGIISRCTEGFNGPGGKPAVRLLPASIRSDKTYAMVGFSFKSPISAFIKLVYCLNQDFPVGQASTDPLGRISNDGDLRVVSVSASVPRAYFSKAEWKLVSPLVGKAAGAIWQDIIYNDRVYVFAAGNEAQGECNRPCDEKYVIGVSACMPYDPAQAWMGPAPELDKKGKPKWRQEGSNLDPRCVSAPGYAIITSTIYPCPNLAYLPQDEMPRAWPDYSFPPRGAGWVQHTNRFCATSSATPQVSALAALLYAQQPGRAYQNVIAAVKDSSAGRQVTASYGQSGGLIDYRTALGWGD